MKTYTAERGLSQLFEWRNGQIPYSNEMVGWLVGWLVGWFRTPGLPKTCTPTSRYAFLLLPNSILVHIPGPYPVGMHQPKPTDLFTERSARGLGIDCSAVTQIRVPKPGDAKMLRAPSLPRVAKQVLKLQPVQHSQAQLAKVQHGNMDSVCAKKKKKKKIDQNTSFSFFDQCPFFVF